MIPTGNAQVTFDKEADELRQASRMDVPNPQPGWHYFWALWTGERAEQMLDWYLNMGYIFVRPGDPDAPKPRVGAEANPLRGNIPINNDPMHAVIRNGSNVLMKVKQEIYENYLESLTRKELRVKGAVKRSPSRQGQEVAAEVRRITGSQSAADEIVGSGPLIYNVDDPADRNAAEGPSDVRELSQADRLRDEETLREQGLQK